MALDLHKPVSTRLGQLLTQSGVRSNKLMWNYKRGRDGYMSARKPARHIESWQEPTLAEAIDWLSRTLLIIVQVEPVVVQKQLMYRAIVYNMSVSISEVTIIDKILAVNTYYSPRTAIQAAITDILKENK
jgi:hypothetical protein